MGRGRNLQRFIESLRPLLIGWGNYFRLAEVKRVFEDLDGWLRRRLRTVVWRQWKRVFSRARNLMKRGLGEVGALRWAAHGRGARGGSGGSAMKQTFTRRLS